MTHDKTSPSFMDRRRFLHHTWFGVGASLSLALAPGDSLRWNDAWDGYPWRH